MYGSIEILQLNLRILTGVVTAALSKKRTKVEVLTRYNMLNDKEANDSEVTARLTSSIREDTTRSASSTDNASDSGLSTCAISFRPVYKSNGTVSKND